MVICLWQGPWHWPDKGCNRWAEDPAGMVNAGL